MKTDINHKFQIFSRMIVLCGFALFFIFSGIFGVLNPQNVKRIVDAFSTDGSFERLSLPLITTLQPFGIVISLLFLALFLLFLLRKSQYQACVRWLVRQFTQLWQDTRACMHAIKIRLNRPDLWFDLLFLLLLAGLLRFFWLERPLEHDEAFTYYVFGRLPLRYAIADYSYPNNHILHTILLKASVMIFGNHTWAMRLPAFLFGAASAPLLYLFARLSTRQRGTAFLAGGLAALYPYMIYYSANARGYSLLAAFSVLAAILAFGMILHKNKALWILFSLIIMAGLYTMPIMLLPAGGLFTWLLLAGLGGKFTSAYGRWGWLKYMFFSGFLIGIGTIILYLPVMQYSGIESLIANPNVSPLRSSEFLPTLGDRLKDTWQEWQAGLPLWLTLPAIAIMLLGFVSPNKKVRQSLTVMLSMLIFLVVYTIVQKPNLWPRVTYYLVPFLILALAYGLSALWQWSSPIWKNKPSLPGLILIIAALSLINTPNYSPLGNRIIGETEQQAERLAHTWQKDQIILIDYPEDMPFVVYLERAGLPATAVRWEQPFRAAYVIVNTAEKQTLESVIRNRGPEIFFFDLSGAEILQTYPNSTLYYVPSNWDLVQKAYQ